MKLNSSRYRKTTPKSVKPKFRGFKKFAILLSVCAVTAISGCGKQESPKPSPLTQKISQEYLYSENEARVQGLYLSDSTVQANLNKTIKQLLVKLSIKTNESFALSVVDLFSKYSVQKEKQVVILLKLIEAVDGYKFVNQGKLPTSGELFELFKFYSTIATKPLRELNQSELDFRKYILEKFGISDFHKKLISFNKKAHPLAYKLRELVGDEVALKVLSSPFLLSLQLGRTTSAERENYELTLLDSIISVIQQAINSGKKIDIPAINSLFEYLKTGKG
ncbi:MAG: hypothetical protein PHU63_02325, partial [Candidatus ainarchaeum sp.]|nr:hypothetical protein [Candidatus ainarchaeum sp.]